MSTIRKDSGELLLDFEGMVKNFSNEREAMVYMKLEGVAGSVENNTQYRLSKIIRPKI